jgi:hypothetical protein
VGGVALRSFDYRKKMKKTHIITHSLSKTKTLTLQMSFCYVLLLASAAAPFAVVGEQLTVPVFSAFSKYGEYYLNLSIGEPAQTFRGKKK